MDQQLKPEEIPYKFYAIFYRHVLKEFSWTWNLRLNGKRVYLSNKWKHRFAVVLSGLAVAAMFIILVCRLFPTGKPSAFIKGVIEKIIGNVEQWIGGFIFIVITVGIIAAIVTYFCGSWSELDRSINTGLALNEHNEKYVTKDIPSELAVSLNRAGNPMCWGYAMRLYCEKKLIDSVNNHKVPFKKEEILAFANGEIAKHSEPLGVDIFKSYIPQKDFWNYNELYIDATADIGTGSMGHRAEIIRFLKQTAHDFCQQYVQADRFWSKKQVWAADPKKTQYFRDTWNARIENLPEGNEIKNQKKEYMDIVISEMQDANENANRHLRERTRLRKRLFILPIATALVSAVTAAVTEMFEKDQLPVWLKITLVVITLTGAALTAWQAVMQEYGKEAEETWLRQKVCFAKLQSETQMFCDSLGDYAKPQSTGETTGEGTNGEGANGRGQSDNSSGNAAASADAAWTTKQIETYIQNIDKIRKTDWKKFFDNMNCGNDVNF